MKKIRWICFVLAGLFLIGILSGCTAQQTYEYTLRVTLSSWSGWTPDYEPEEFTYTYIVTEGDILAPPERESWTAEILRADENGILFSTSEPLSVINEDGTINLSSWDDTFEIHPGETLSLATPSTDYGEIYIFELE